MSVWMYVKLVLAAALLWEAYHLGGDAMSVKYEKAELAMAKATAAALDARDAQILTVENQYDALKDIPDPATVGAATRLRLVTVESDCPVPGAPVAGGAHGTGAVSGGDAAIERATQGVFDACDADAKELNAVIRLAPKGTTP